MLHVSYISIKLGEGFSGGSVVKNLPANAGDIGSIPGGKIPHATQQLSLCTTTIEPVPWIPRVTATEARAPWSLHSETREATSVRSLRTTTSTDAE